MHRVLLSFLGVQRHLPGIWSFISRSVYNKSRWAPDQHVPCSGSHGLEGGCLPVLLGQSGCLYLPSVCCHLSGFAMSNVGKSFHDPGGSSVVAKDMVLLVDEPLKLSML